MLWSVIVWIHVITTVVAIGGATFVLFVLRPIAMKNLEPPVAGKLMMAIQVRFRVVQWVAIGIFSITGIWAAYQYRGIRSMDALTGTPFGRTLLIKSLLALLLFAGALAASLPLPALAKLRPHGPKIMAMNITLAVIIMLLASILVRRGGVLF